MAEEVKVMNIIPFNKLNRKNQQEDYVKKHNIEFYNYLNDSYPKDISFKEKLYWYYHNICSYPVCSECGKRTRFRNFRDGYGKYCSVKCSRNSDETKDKIIKTNIKRYGTGCALSSDICKAKVRQTFVKKYGVENPYQSEEIKKKIRQTCIRKYGVDNFTKTQEYKDYMKSLGDIPKIKAKETYRRKYGVDNFTKTQEYLEKSRETCIERYGIDSYMKTKECQEKRHTTMSNNNTFSTSKIEVDFKRWLDKNNIKYIYQYRSEKYPFNCDFYFPDRDMYFEINGNWTHGFHPYDPDSPEDRETLDIWKSKDTDYYDIAINVWTKSDPKKMETAKQNNLNWKCVYSIDLDEIIKSFKENYGI